MFTVVTEGNTCFLIIERAAMCFYTKKWLYGMQDNGYGGIKTMKMENVLEVEKCPLKVDFIG